MKIEAGKSYRTRDGRKATVLAEFPQEVTSDRFAGYCGSTPLTWRENGNFLARGENRNDLLREWSEQTPTPFEKARDGFGSYQDAWNAAIDHAINRVVDECTSGNISLITKITEAILRLEAKV